MYNARFVYQTYHDAYVHRHTTRPATPCNTQYENLVGRTFYQNNFNNPLKMNGHTQLQCQTDSFTTFNCQSIHIDPSINYLPQNKRTA
jgi:hypothetical protein